MARAARPAGSERCGIPREPVRVGEGPGIAANHEPARSGAFGRDAGVLGQGTAPVERQLDGTRRSGELDVLAAKALRHGEAAVNVEPLARGHVRDSQPEHDLVDPPGGRTSVLLRRGRDLPDRPVRGSYDAAVAPERLRGRLQRRGAGVEGSADEAADGGWLRHRERQRKPTEAGRRCLRGPQAYLSAQAEGGGVEAVDGGGVGYLKSDGFDGSHGDQASCGSVTRASRILIDLVTCFATHAFTGPTSSP